MRSRDGAVLALALGLLAPTLQPDINAEPTLAVQGLFYFILINIFLGIFNLLPIPPFDGSHIVEGLMPRRYVHLYEKLRPFGMLLFLGLVLLTWFAPEWGVLDKTLGPPVEWALRHYLALADSIS